MSGVQFHQASVLEALLDLIEDGEGGSLTVEWGPHIADYERSGRDGVLRCVVRARAGTQSLVVSSDLWTAVRRWASLDAPEATFVYHAEAALYATAVSIVAERLDRFAAGVPTDEDRTVVQMIGLPCEGRCLRHVQLRMRSGPLDKMVVGIRWRVQRLIEPAGRRDPAVGDGRRWLRPEGNRQREGNGQPDETQRVTEAIDRLLQRCRADRRKARTIGPEEACEALGVDPGRSADSDGLLGPGGAGSEQRAGCDRDTALVGRYLSSAFVAGPDGPCDPGERPSPCVVPADHAAALPVPEPIIGLVRLPGAGGAAILGPASPRMDAAIDAIRRAAAAGGGMPFVMEVRGYRYRSFVTRVRQQLELTAGVQVSAAAARHFLERAGLVLLLDAGLASVDAEMALVQDLHAVRAANPSLRVFTFGMGSGQARILGLPLFRLQASPRTVTGDVGTLD